MLCESERTELAYKRLVDQSFYPMQVRTPVRDASFAADFATRHVGCFKKTRSKVLHGSPIFGTRSWRDIQERAGDEFLLVAPVSGTVVLQQFGRSVELDSAQMVLIDLQTPYDLERRSAGTVVSHHIAGSVLREVTNDPRAYCAIGFDTHRGVGDAVRSLVASSWRQIRCLDAAERSLLLHNIASLVTVACGNSSRQKVRTVCIPPLFVRSIEFIERNLEDPELSVGKVAAAIGASVSNLHATMKKHGTSVGATILNMRLDRCAHNLLAVAPEGARISDIAYAQGFSDSAHFSKVFRARFGCSPRQYKAGGKIRLEEIVNLSSK